MTWSQIEHTGDVGLEIEAPDLPELFTEALAGTIDCVTDVGAVEPRDSWPVEVAAPDLEQLLIEWLAEALYRFDVERFLAVGGDVEIEETEEGWRLTGSLHGETWDPELHPIKLEVKAATYHQLTVEKTPDGWFARVILDI